MSIIEKPRNGGGRTDPDNIDNVIERKFFILFSRLLKKMPGATIVHEPTFFEVQSGPNTISGTLPDFLITRPDGRRIYVEITSSKKNNGSSEEAKSRQKRLMSQTSEDIKYVVLYKENLEAIQKRHPEVQFFP